MKILKEAYYSWGAEGPVTNSLCTASAVLTRFLCSRFHHVELYREFGDDARLQGGGYSGIRHFMGFCAC